jgi:hypothetical protein
MRTVYIGTLTAFVLTCFFPPWLNTFDHNGQYGGHSRKSAGYCFIATPPTPQSSPFYGVQIDFTRLAIEWLCLAAITGAGWLLVKNRTEQRFIVDTDYSLPLMVKQASAAKGGRALTPREIQRLVESYEERQATWSEEASKRAHEEMISEVTVPVSPNAAGYRKTASNPFEAAKASLLERQRTVLREEGALPTEDLTDYGTVGAGHLLEGIKNRAAWEKEMISDFGDGVRTHLDRIYEKSNELMPVFAEGHRTAAVDKIVKIHELIRDRVANGEKPGDFGGLIQALARAAVEGGIRNRDSLIDSVHRGLKNAGIEITRRQTMDAISGYGDFQALLKGDAEVPSRLRQQA